MTGVRTEEVTYCRVTWARARPRRDGAAAARILGRFHGSHYYDWAYTNSRFGFFQRPVNIKREGTVVSNSVGVSLVSRTDCGPARLS